MMRHYALFGVDLAPGSPLLDDLLGGRSAFFPEIRGKKGLLFSNLTLAACMAEEKRLDHFHLTGQAGRSICSLSGGERKKALLGHLLAQQPDFLVLDNPFDALDAAASQQLREELRQVSRRLTFIQIGKRYDDLLPCITHAVCFDGDRPVFAGPLAEWLQNRHPAPAIVLPAVLPGPSRRYEDISDPLVRFDNVSVSYQGCPILNGISWEIRREEFWQLVGPNGAGKTTLLTMITGDNPKAFGASLTLFGRKKGSGETVWELKEKIGYLTPAMMDHFHRRNTVEEMIISGMVDCVGLYRQASSSQRFLARQWLRLLGLEKRRDAAFLSLSQVQQRLVLVARAMVKHPPLLILDEPADGLDDAAAMLLISLIDTMAAGSRSALVYVSHRQEPGLHAPNVFDLVPSPKGSCGIRRQGAGCSIAG